ncbi:MAG: CHAT domain-containing protein, partial [Acidobacteria bacterium]|nr:CHAT domain-containing protein [Acidobacteriota bacterium]
PVFTPSDPRLAGQMGPQPNAEGSRSGHRGTSPAQGFERLPYSGREAEAIRALAGSGESFEALGFAARREAVLDPSLGRYRFLHLATHGVIDTERPELSRLVFSLFDEEGKPSNGTVFAHELYDLELAADLVVLSACDTALGRQMRGEGLLGLPQGFLQAGAAGVVVSLWRVDDLATAELMELFYRALLKDGLGPAAALRQAQLSIRERSPWQAPYYWAGFQLQGEWRLNPGPAPGI